MPIYLDACIVRYNTANGKAAKIGRRVEGDRDTLVDMLALQGPREITNCIFEHDPDLPRGTILIEG